MINNACTTPTDQQCMNSYLQTQQCINSIYSNMQITKQLSSKLVNTKDSTNHQLIQGEENPKQGRRGESSKKGGQDLWREEQEQESRNIRQKKSKPKAETRRDKEGRNQDDTLGLNARQKDSLERQLRLEGMEQAGARIGQVLGGQNLGQDTNTRTRMTNTRVQDLSQEVRQGLGSGYQCQKGSLGCGGGRSQALGILLGFRKDRNQDQEVRQAQE